MPTSQTTATTSTSGSTHEVPLTAADSAPDPASTAAAPSRRRHHVDRFGRAGRPERGPAGGRRRSGGGVGRRPVGARTAGGGAASSRSAGSDRPSRPESGERASGLQARRHAAARSSPRAHDHHPPAGGRAATRSVARCRTVDACGSQSSVASSRATPWMPRRLPATSSRADSAVRSPSDRDQQPGGDRSRRRHLVARSGSSTARPASTSSAMSCPWAITAPRVRDQPHLVVAGQQVQADRRGQGDRGLQARPGAAPACAHRPGGRAARRRRRARPARPAGPSGRRAGPRRASGWCGCRRRCGRGGCRHPGRRRRC